MATSDANATVNADKSVEVPVWDNLVDWIEQAGGHVNRDLQLLAVDPEQGPKEGKQQEAPQRQVEHRGVFCSTGIQKGECLIRLPAALTVNGKNLPSEYKLPTESSNKAVSPWLRCLAAYYQAQQQEQATDSAHDNNHSNYYTAYMASLPENYETVWDWTNDELESYLMGTTTVAAADCSDDVGEWNNNHKGRELSVLQQRYRDSIRPYLQYCGCLVDHDTVVSDTEFRRFQTACQCLYTRGFHLTLSETERDPDVDVHTDANADPSATSTSSSYNGPFLLPWIDLLNHCSRSSNTNNNNNNNNNNTKCTTLRRLPDDTFVMMAERDIAPGEEILHSYGDELTASDFLQTFGFVPDTAVEQALASQSSLPNSNCIPVTPAVLSKTAVLEACWSVMVSNIPQQLAASMREQEMEDEVWAVSVDRSRTASFISENLIIDSSSPDESILNDELVTLACLPFFPVCAYAEIKADRTLLDSSILEDYYLGKLVCTSLLKAIQSKLETYAPIRKMNANGTANSSSSNGSWEPADDRELLRQVVQQEQASPNSVSTSTRRLMYALVVRLEEKSCLEALRRKVIGILARLDQEAADEFTMNNSETGGEDANGKRPKTCNE